MHSENQSQPSLQKQAIISVKGILHRLSQPAWLLAAIVILAFAIRLALVPYGLPLLLYEDEPIYYDHALGFGLGHWDLGYFKKPTFFLYFYSAFYYLGFLYTPYMSWQGFVDAFWEDPTLVAVIGRTVSSIFAAGAVFLLGRIGWRVFSWPVGLVAAFFLTVNTTHLRISPIVISDIPALFFILAAAWFALGIAKHGRSKDYLYCALMIALAVSFKYNVFSVFFLLTGHLAYYLYHPKAESNQPRKNALREAISDKRFWAALCLIPIAFLLLNLTVLLDLSTFWEHLNLEKRHMLLKDANSTTEQWRPMVAFESIFYKILPRSLGWPIYVTGLLGMGWALIKYRPLSWVLLSFPIAFLLVVLQFRLINAKYLLPLFPFWALMSAVFLNDLIFSNKFSNQARWLRWLSRRYLGVLFVSSVLLISLFNIQESSHYVAIHLQPDTRHTALTEIKAIAQTHDRFLLEPDTLTLDNRKIRRDWMMVEFRDGNFHNISHSVSNHLNKLGLLELQPRYVLIDFGKAIKRKNAQGNTYYEMPYESNYYQILQKYYQFRTVLAPYNVNLKHTEMQLLLMEEGFGPLYQQIQKHKTDRKRPGPIILMLERR